jgi:hypothetical protein
LKWKNSDPARGIDTSPAIGYDDKIYVGSWDRFVYQLDLQTGLVEWWWPYKGYYFTEDTEDYCFYGGIFSSPAIGPDGSIYIANDTVNRDSECAPEDDYFYFRLTPCGRNCAGGFRVSLGEEDVYSTAAVRNDLSSYIGYGKRIVHVLPDGVQVWSYETGGKVDSSPALDFNSNVYVGSADGYLYALAGNGDLLWKFETYGPISSSPAIGPDGAIYFGSDDGWLYTLGGALCPVSVLLQGEEESLGRFRTLRDRVLRNSPQGRIFCAAYYRFSDEIVSIFATHPRLQHMALDITEYLLARLTLIERGQRIHIPQRQMDHIVTCMAGIEQQASPELRSIIRQLRAEMSRRRWFRHLGIEWD